MYMYKEIRKYHEKKHSFERSSKKRTSLGYSVIATVLTRIFP